MKMEMTTGLIIAVAVFGFFCIGTVMVIYGSIVRNSWGINTGDVFCPHCEAALPRIHKPRSLRQSVWGGWTCPACGAEVDKWGRLLALGSGHPPSDYNPYLVKGHSPVVWVVSLVVILVNGLYDYYQPEGVLIDIALLIALLIWWRRARCRSTLA